LTIKLFSILPFLGGDFKRARNAHFPFLTAAWDPDVFSSKLNTFKINFFLGGDFKRARNPQFPFQTAARDPDVFNSKLNAFKKVKYLIF
jgi:hypothetical protein